MSGLVAWVAGVLDQGRQWSPKAELTLRLLFEGTDCGFVTV